MASYNTFGSGMFESMTFQTPYSQIEESMFTNIDPTLESSSPSPFDSLCGPPVQRFLGDAHRTAYFNIDIPMHVAEVRSQPRASTAISALPPASQVRFVSPFSSSEPSSSGGGQSPPAETEYTDYDNGPMTPPEMHMFPSYSVPREPFAHSLQFTSMGPSYTNGIELQANHQHEYTDNESIVDFAMPTRSNSFENGFGANYYDPVQRTVTPATSTPSDRVQPVVKEEYPPLPKADQEDNASDEDAASSPKRQNESDEDDDDDDYRPSKKSKPSGRTPVRRHPRGRQPAAAIGTITTLTTTNNGIPSPISRKRSHRPSTGQDGQQHHASPPRALPHNPKGFVCNECPKRDFKDRADYDNHVKKLHTRPFPCVFNFAGCDSTFASKNEWKRHVTTQHLLLQYWLCQEGMCAKTCNNANSSSGGSGQRRVVIDSESSSSSGNNTLPNGAIFNRKDLFTQHLKRMHTPTQVKRLPGHSAKGGSPASSSKTPGGDNGNTHSPQEKELLAKWNTRLRTLQERGRRDRCKLPILMRCPVESCEEPRFQGPEAWDQRMEHVAKHLERAASGKEPDVIFGGEEDVTLVEWANRADVGIITRDQSGQGWELRKPLERTGGRVIVILPGSGNAVKEEVTPKTHHHQRKGSSIVVKKEEMSGDEEMGMGEGEEDADGEEE